MNELLFIILDILGLLFLYKWFGYQRLLYKDFSADRLSFFTFKRFGILVITIGIILFPIVLINFTSIENYVVFPAFHSKGTKQAVFALLISSFISFVWLFYIYKIDVFNKEKKRHILFVFLFSALLTAFVPEVYNLADGLGFKITNISSHNFYYSVFVIGFIEETTKLIPFLILLNYTKAIDEPFDYILYATVSALGFSWVENTSYLYEYGLEIVNARALYASIAHMTFSSFTAYALFLVKYKKTKFPNFLTIAFFYLLALFSHGFYDFWYIDLHFKSFAWISTLFLLILIHVWFSMKNNALNMSDFYTENIKINNDKLKIFLSVSLLIIFMFSYVYVAFALSSSKANKFFKENLLIYGYTIFYIVATLTKYKLVKGKMNPFKYSLSFLMPKHKN